MFDIRKKKAFVCDLDGTLFMGPNPIAPAVDFVIRNTKSGRFRYYYLTNNTSKCPDEYLKKIAGADIPVTADQILTPLITLEAYIREKGYRSVYLLASEKVKAHLAARLADAGVTFEYDPDGNELFSHTAPRAAGNLVFTDPALREGDLCTVSVNGSTVTATACLGSNGDGFGGPGDFGRGGRRQGPGGNAPEMPADGTVPQMPDGMTPPDGTVPQMPDGMTLPNGAMPGNGMIPQPPDGMTPPDGTAPDMSSDGTAPQTPGTGA